jgi:hypothetical protein
MDGTCSVGCPMAGSGVSGCHASDSTTKELLHHLLVRVLMSRLLTSALKCQPHTAYSEELFRDRTDITFANR